ncbi:hypothetical protein [Candidatus Phytoplasma pini]|nr:hypothetical protein [Candidatus Phytoplasma pini]
MGSYIASICNLKTSCTILSLMVVRPSGLVLSLLLGISILRTGWGL